MGTFVIYITMWCVICARKNKDLGEWISLSLKTTFQLCEVNMMSFSNHQFSQRTNARCQIGVSGSHMTSDFMVSVTVYSLAVGAHTWKTTSFATALQVIPIQEDVISVDYSYIPICIPWPEKPSLCCLCHRLAQAFFCLCYRSQQAESEFQQNNQDNGHYHGLLLRILLTADHLRVHWCSGPVRILHLEGTDRHSILWKFLGEPIYLCLAPERFQQGFQNIVVCQTEPEKNRKQLVQKFSVRSTEPRVMSTTHQQAFSRVCRSSLKKQYCTIILCCCTCVRKDSLNFLLTLPRQSCCLKVLQSFCAILFSVAIYVHCFFQMVWKHSFCDNTKSGIVCTCLRKDLWFSLTNTWLGNKQAWKDTRHSAHLFANSVFERKWSEYTAGSTSKLWRQWKGCGRISAWSICRPEDCEWKRGQWGSHGSQPRLCQGKARHSPFAINQSTQNPGLIPLQNNAKRFTCSAAPTCIAKPSHDMYQTTAKQTTDSFPAQSKYSHGHFWIFFLFLRHVEGFFLRS